MTVDREKEDGVSLRPFLDLGGRAEGPGGEAPPGLGEPIISHCQASRLSGTGRFQAYNDHQYAQRLLQILVANGFGFCPFLAFILL